MSYSSRFLLLFFAFACTNSVLAQSDLDAIPIESLVKETRWIPIHLDHERSRSAKNAAFGIRIQLPDGTMHSLGDPYLGEWAEKMSNRALNSSDLSKWTSIVHYYRPENAERKLLNIAQDKGIIHLSLALVATPQSTDVLKQLLSKPNPKPMPERGTDPYRYNKPYLAAALLRLGDEEATKLILSEYRKYLINTRDTYGNHVFPDIIEDAYGPQLIKGMLALAAEAPKSNLQISRHDLLKQVNQMKVRGLPLEDLCLLVEGRHPKITGWRNEAVFLVAEYGTVQDLRRLEKLLKQMKDDLVMALAKDRAATYKSPWSENERVIGHLEYGLILMRCRLWKELKK